MKSSNYLGISNFKTVLCVASCLAMFTVGAVSLPAQDSVAPDSAENTAPAPEPPANLPADPSAQGDQPNQQSPAPKRLPATLTVSSGTLITIRMAGWLSSDQNKPGDTFRAELQDPLVAQGWVVSRQGQTVYGEVAVAQKAGRGKGVSQLGLQLTRLILVDGQQLPIQTQMVQQSGASSQGRDAAAIGTTTGVGAVIGAAADAGTGAAVGGAAGAAAGVTGVLLTRGRPTIVPPGRLLTFELQTPLAISTGDSFVAFRPVDQTDLTASSNAPAAPQAIGAPYPPPSAYPPPAAYSYPYPYAYDPYFYNWGWWGYPGPFIGLGFYGGGGWGPRFGGFGLRGGFRR